MLTRSKPMSRGKALQRTGMRRIRPQANKHPAEKPSRPAPRSEFIPTRPYNRRPSAVVARVDDVVRAQPKTVPQRNPHLLAMCRDKPCLLLVPACCNHRLDTTVPCHSNQSKHGKAGRRKADDQWHVQGCKPCHDWLDTGPAPQEQKNAVFDAAHQRQVLTWEEIVADPQQPLADRRAAQWALDRV